MQQHPNWRNYCVIKVRLFIAVLLIPLSLAFFTLPTAAQDRSDDTAPVVEKAGTTYARAHEIDEMLSKYFKPGEPGASDIVSHRSAILFRANRNSHSARAQLRSNLPLLRSCCLPGKGKLSLDPEAGRHVTTENLRTHTPGFRDFTELPQFSVGLT